jgi:outer membrane protein TolC
MVVAFATVSFGQQSSQPPGQPPTSQPVSPAPSGSNPTGQSGQQQPEGVQPAPSGNTPQAPAPAPGSNARPVTPSGQIEQSIQPSTQADQQNRGNQPAPQTQPQTPAGGEGNQLNSQPQPPVITPNTNQPQSAAPQGQGMTSPANPAQPGQESVPTVAPDQLMPVPQIAPNFRAPSAPLPELGRVGVNLSDERPLTVREAIEMALANNKDIEVARQNVKISEFDLTSARGAYDPRFSSLSYYERSVTPSANVLSGGQRGTVTQSDITGTARLEGLSPKYGGGYRIDFSAIRLTTDNIFSALNPQYPTALTLSYTQPLWRGMRIDQPRRQVEIAKKNLSLTDAQFRQRAIETITNVQRAYWDLVFALRNLQIQRDAVRDARTQYEHNKRLVAEGMLAPIDVVAAEAQVSGFEESVYSALEDVGRAENNLKNMIAENRQSRIWGQSLLPTDPVDLQPPSVALDDALKTALENRPEVQQLQVSREINQIDQKFYKDQTKPQIDLVGTYGVTGLTGAQNPLGANPLTQQNQELRAQVNLLSAIAGLPPVPEPPPATLPASALGGLGSSLSELAQSRFPNFRVGVQIGIPIRNRTAEGELGRALVTGQQIATQREQLEQNIQVEVRNTLQVVRTAQSRLRAAAAARSASEQQYSSEQRKFDAGQSTLFLVLERQTALTTARGNELRAQTDLNKAIADFQRATGNALQVNNVVARVR